MTSRPPPTTTTTVDCASPTLPHWAFATVRFAERWLRALAWIGSMSPVGLRVDVRVRFCRRPASARR